MGATEKAMLKYVAEVSVGPSTTQSYRRANEEFSYADFLSSRNLNVLASMDERRFQKWLNTNSTKLSKNIQPIKNPEVSTWGMARKILNIFLHNVYYNTVLRSAYNLTNIEDFFEVPLDSHVVGWLLRIAESTEPPIDFKNPIQGTFAIYKVDRIKNSNFQQLAKQAAKQMGTNRVLLDAHLYRAKEKIWIYRDRID